MKESWPGATVQRIATRLAVHQLLDDPRVFDDPLALSITGSDRALTLRTDPYRFETTVQSSYLRAFVAARSRYAEDELAVGIESGVRQYVILSAGLATFAYRNPYPPGTLRVFEVDHPETQGWKRSRHTEIAHGSHSSIPCRWQKNCELWGSATSKTAGRKRSTRGTLHTAKTDSRSGTCHT
jgi:methyltransferase (TIGR00027 family)